MDAYQRRCAISGCKTECVLEAAHIVAASYDKNSFHMKNGLLLRADIHLLFDKGLIKIDPDTLKIYVSETIRDSEYTRYHGKTLRKTRNLEQSPDHRVLKWKWKNS
jgi:predicted restriction endonuclease